jgi:hypothetical protein
LSEEGDICAVCEAFADNACALRDAYIQSATLSANCPQNGSAHTVDGTTSILRYAHVGEADWRRSPVNSSVNVALLRIIKSGVFQRVLECDI